MKQQMHATIHGRVQGVFFRDTTCKIARKLNLTGTVRNLPDGGVEIFAEGELETLCELIICLRKEYPSSVSSIATDYTSHLEGFTSFNVIH